MEKKDLREQQFLTLRREIEGQQWRSYFTVVIGLLGIPYLGSVLLRAESYIWLIFPLLVLMVIMLYLLQQIDMMRAGRYIRERLEKDAELGLGWETWLESKPHFRHMEVQFSRWFILIFFIYFALALGIALHRVILDALTDVSGKAWTYAYAAIAAYSITTVWAIYTVIAHWRSAVATTEE